MVKRLGIVNILEPVFLDTLLQKSHTLGARIRFYELVEALQPRISGNMNNVHVGTPKIMDITELFNHVFLGVDAGIGIAGAATPGAESVGGLGYDFTAFYESRHVYTGEMGIAQINSTTITDNLI